MLSESLAERPGQVSLSYLFSNWLFQVHFGIFGNNNQRSFRVATTISGKNSPIFPGICSEMILIGQMWGIGEP